MTAPERAKEEETDARRAQAYELHLQKKTHREIGAVLGVNESRAGKILHMHPSFVGVDSPATRFPGLPRRIVNLLITAGVDSERDIPQAIRSGALRRTRGVGPYVIQTVKRWLANRETGHK